MKKIGVTSVLLVLFVCYAWSLEGLRFENITNKEGLSQNTVRHIMQDSHGFMWMATMNGLNRYDGRKFLVMKPKAGSSIGLPDNRVKSVLEDKHGFLWIKTYSDMIACYNTRTEQFVECEGSSVELKLFQDLLVASNGDIWTWGSQVGLYRIRCQHHKLYSKSFNEGVRAPVNFVYESADATIWVGTEKGLFREKDYGFIRCYTGEEQTRISQVVETDDHLLFFTRKGKMLVFGKEDKTYLYSLGIQEPNQVNATLNAVERLPSGEVLILTRKSSLLFDEKTRTITPALHLMQGKPLENAYSIRDNKGALWLYNGTGFLWQYLPEANVFTAHQLIPPFILALIDFERFVVYHDSRNIIWITTYGNGLFALDLNTGKTTHFTSGQLQENWLYTNYLLSITEDASGEIWIGSEHSGVIKLSLTNYKTRIVYPEPRKNDLSNNAIRLIYEDAGGEMWLGSRSGHIYVYDEWFNEERSYNVPGGMAYAVAEDTLGNKWVGTKGSGLLIFPRHNRQAFSVYTSKSNETESLASNNIYSILRDTKGRMWVGTFGGGLHLAEWRGDRLVFHQYLTVSYNQSVIRALLQDKDGLIWVGTNEGVCVFDPDVLIRNKNGYVSFVFDSKEEASLSSNEVKSVFQDSKGRIWLGTSGGGINLLERKEKLEESVFKHYTSQNGLSNDVVQAIIEDNDGFLWISTEGGISKFDPEEEMFERFNFSDNRQAGLFCEASCWKRKNGDLMFGSYNGLYVFNPSELFMSSSYAPKVKITNLKVNGNTVVPGDKDVPLTENISSTRKVRLNYDQNSFSLEFAMLNFHKSSDNRYTYILEGYEREWNPISEYNVATYKNLPSGNYTFKVKGCNSFGVWNDAETLVDIVVVPPFWMSNQALVLYMLLIAVVSFFILRTMYKMNKLNNDVKVEKQLSEYKIRFFTNISHEFRTPLTIIQGAIDSLADIQGLPELAGKQVGLLKKSSGRLMRLIDQLLEFRRLQNDKMELRLESTEVVGFFHDIYKMFTETAEKKKIQFLFNSNLSAWEMFLDRGKMDKIAYNLLSNAFKYTPEKGTVIMRVCVDEEADLLELLVEDNGLGIPKDQQAFLFTRFKQINYSSSGTGIGLNLTAELASVHKGRIAYTDAELGGSCFTVTIPLSAKNYQEEEFVERIPQEDLSGYALSGSVVDLKGIIGSKSLKEYKLLIVEDDEEVREYLQGELDAYFTVSTAENGLVGLNRAEKMQPDLIVCDVMMPEMNGFDVTKKLKSTFETSHIPIILLTAHSSTEHQMEGIQSGADAYVIKPFNMKYLILRIIKLIDQRERLQQKFARELSALSPTICSSEKDGELIDRLNKAIEANLGNGEFSVDTFAQTVGLGRTVFYRKVKALTGYSPNEYLRIHRMKKGAELLRNTNKTVAEVTYAVGMNDPFYFSRIFKNQFGKSPSAYQKGDDEED